MSREVMQKVLSSLMNLQPIIANGLLDKRQLAFIDPHLDMACEALIAELAKPDHIPDAGKMVEPVLFIHPLTFEMASAHVGAWKPGHELPGYIALYATPPQRQPLTTDEYTAIAHRTASKYSHRSNPTFVAYTFLPHTLEDFVRTIEAAYGTKEQP